MQNYPSKLLEQAVNELSRLPGIGRKTALRLALHLVRSQPSEVEKLGESLIRLRSEIRYCRECSNISDDEICSICADPRRDHGLVCVVETIRDVMAIENTGQFSGVYHVLGGIISPIEGIGPQDLHLEALLTRAGNGLIREVLLALPATIEGDTTNFFLYRKLLEFELKITTIARGISVGDELEHTDEVTLGRSILNRTPYESGMSRK
ncbi:MAG TPA: recombination mediator RecR [Bacteroidales bacterium]|nr:recombination mediator RecR [Bacteroidales bacterium]HPT09324.1 recombination mediator RecR [Bacteroidales bacterium]